MTRKKQGQKLPEGVGKVTHTNGQDGVCELGLALRLGIGRAPTSETATEMYPLFELLPGEERPTAGEVIEGFPVFAWVDQATAAKLLSLTTRQVQNLEGKGMPHRGHAATKRYPLPHIVIWRGAFLGGGGGEGRVGRLSMRVALAHHQVRMAQDELKALQHA